MFERCPKAWLRDDAQAEAALINDALVFLEHHLPPSEGGLLDQDPVWVEAVALVDHEMRAHQQRAIEREQECMRQPTRGARRGN